MQINPQVTGRQREGWARWKDIITNHTALWAVAENKSNFHHRFLAKTLGSSMTRCISFNILIFWKKMCDTKYHKWFKCKPVISKRNTIKARHAFWDSTSCTFNNKIPNSYLRVCHQFFKTIGKRDQSYLLKIMPSILCALECVHI